jgi:hypothetical protein
LALLLIAAIGWFYAHVIDTQNMGFTHDDGVYAITGKALAEGKGFTLLHVVGQPPEVKYPFVYPAILSLVWMVSPHYPENLPALNGITIAFTLAACGMIYLFLRRAQHFPGWLALLLIAQTASHYFFIYFFSSVMSEAPYLFFSMLTLWCAHRFIAKNAVLPHRDIWVLVALSCVTFLTRIPGLSLMAAIVAWLLLNGQWKNAVRYGTGCLAFGIFPWALWVKFQTPTLTELNYPLVNAYSNYGLEFFHNLLGSNYWASLPRDVNGLMAAILQQLFPIIPNFTRAYPKLSRINWITATNGVVMLLGQYLCMGYFMLQLVQTISRSNAVGKIRANRMWNPSVFSIPGLYLVFYLLMITFWNYEDQLARFLTCVSPLLWMYFYKPWLKVLPDFGKSFDPGPAQRKQAVIAVAGVCLSVLLSFWLVPSAYKTVYTSRSQHWVDNGKYRWMWSDYQATFAWINQTIPPQASLAAASDVVFYLYTNRPTFYTFFASLRRKHDEFTPDSIPLLMRSLDFYHIRYLVAEPHMLSRVIKMPINVVAKQLLETYPQRFKLAYTSPHGAIKVYKILRKNAER